MREKPFFFWVLLNALKLEMTFRRFPVKQIIFTDIGHHWETWLFLCWAAWGPSSLCCSFSSSSYSSSLFWECNSSEESELIRVGRLFGLFEVMQSIYHVLSRWNFDNGRPTSHFDTFPVALLTVFQVKFKNWKTICIIQVKMIF